MNMNMGRDISIYSTINRKRIEKALMLGKIEGRRKRG